MTDYSYVDYPATFDDFQGFYSDDHFLRSKGAYFDYLIKKRPEVDSLKKLYNFYAQDHCFRAISITLQKRYKQLDELRQRNVVFSALNATQVSSYILYPDVDLSGNFHYHGIVKIPLAEMPKFKRFFTEKVGFIKFSYLSDIEGWYSYMRKDKGFKSKEHPVPLTEAIYTDYRLRLYALSK